MPQEILEPAWVEAFENVCALQVNVGKVVA